jgi:hypothetical protein
MKYIGFPIVIVIFSVFFWILDRQKTREDKVTVITVFFALFIGAAVLANVLTTPPTYTVLGTIKKTWTEGRWNNRYYASITADGETTTYTVRDRAHWGSLSAGDLVTVTVQQRSLEQVITEVTR